MTRAEAMAIAAALRSEGGYVSDRGPAEFVDAILALTEPGPDVDLAAMRARALAALPQQWPPRDLRVCAGFDVQVCIGPVTDRAATHIAGCDPGTIVAMLDRLERSERERDEARRELAIRTPDEDGAA